MATERFTSEQIRNFWTEQAQMHGQSPAASWSDKECIDLEIRTITSFLEEGDKVLDAGCANGYSSVQYAMQKRANVRGVDYIPEMVEQAKSRLPQLKDLLLGKLEFDVGNILKLEEPSHAYDKVIVTRVVINLDSWEMQAQAIRECARVLKPGGMLLLSEATMQGWKKLNRFRQEWKLPEIPMPSFNLYLDQDQVIKTASSAGLELVKVDNFASTYFIGTRIIKPLLAKIAEVDAANPEMEWNRWFANAPAFGDYGTQKLFIFRKN
jgi:ubiquinone/menaquinone biosynthesis C-methylase UbiE